MSEEKIPVLAKKIGFPQDKIMLLREALTHRTYAVEKHVAYDNQRMEFLGDAVLEIILTEYLYLRYPDMPEGDMTKVRSALSCEQTLSSIARQIDLGSCLLIGNGEKECGGYDRDSTLCDLFEAVIGAIHLACGIEKTREFILPLFEKNFPEPANLLLSMNPKGKLQEITQERWHKTPEYSLLRCTGARHQPLYDVEVHADRYVASGSGCSRKAAETAAAAMLLQFLIRRFKL